MSSLLLHIFSNMALKKQHKARWNCNMGKYQLGRGTITTYSSKWEMTVFEIQTRDTHTPPTHTCPVLRQTYAWLCLISHCVFFVLYSYTFVQNFNDNTMPWINLSEYWRTLPPSKSRPIKSYDTAQTSHGKQIHKPMEYTHTFSFSSFLPCKIDF